MTLDPCLSCLKLIISAGITEIYYETELKKTEDSVRDSFKNLVKLRKIVVPQEIKEQVSEFIVP
ncbi:hypothetical protein NG799_02255 [Laspinema sp. D1]|uniref:CMP/dCMP-type deaminase domain-containing protein n=1 Tax=Laspinema palackyanum D2a TaxID=2953684 RepID=A0ABT2MK84_9CYAN|nr:hypothetical protein [Laspinema sp. D2a]